MPIVLKVISNKYFIILSAILALCGTAYLLGTSHEKNIKQKQIEQKAETDKEQELESLNTQLGISNSQIVSSKQLNEQLSKENDALKKQVQEYAKKYNLAIQSIDNSIVSVVQQDTGVKHTELSTANQITPITPLNTNSTITISPNETLSYEWQDDLGRFKLTDPDIFKKGSETFSANQYFKIYGEIYKEKDGKLETRRMVLKEVFPVKDAKGKTTYKEVDGTTVSLVDSQFNYTQDGNAKKLFHLRPILTFDTNKNIGLGAEFLSFHGFGINAHTGFDTQAFSNSSIRLGIAYNPQFKIFENVGFGTSIGTPFNNMFHTYNLTFDLIFYLGN